MTAVKQNWNALEFIKDQTNEICLEAIKKDPWALQLVKDQTNEICLEAVRKDGWALKYVKDQTNEICLEAVKPRSSILAFVKNQTEEMCIEAVKQHGNNLHVVKKQTDNICKEALNNNFNDSVLFVDIKEKSTAVIVLEASLKNIKNTKNKVILNRIINKFSEDEEIVDFYTKHKLWKYVDFKKLNIELTQYGMTL